MVSVAAFAALVAGCPTGADSDPSTDDAGTLEDGGPIGNDSALPPGSDGAAPPSACSRLTTLCKDGEKCAGAPDCGSKVCFGGVCVAAAPADGTKNGDETDVDCGGSKAPACADGKACVVKSDCTSGVCTANVCQAPRRRTACRTATRPAWIAEARDCRAEVP